MLITIRLAAAMITICIFTTACRPAIAEHNSPILPPVDYGRHYPNGDAAVQYIFGPDGMWKETHSVEYVWNYYQNCEAPDHPFDRNALTDAADGTRFFTAPDANCHLLFDWNHDGEIDTPNGGSAFHEHNGEGVNGETIGEPFTNFWFDDNWLARYMTATYGRPAPDGLSNYDGFTRWRIIGGDPTNWTPYGDDDFDRLALDGLFYVATNDVNQAVEQWDRIRDKSGFDYDSGNHRYQYSNIHENYHLGLFEILTAFLLDHPSVTDTKRHELLQHWVSLRSNILSNQEKNDSNLYGWRTHIEKTDSLINTETIAINVLALGANSLYGFEAGQPPLQMEDHNYLVRSYNVLSAITGSSRPGYMTFGPYQQYPPNAYLADFFLRSESPIGKMATLNVYDAQSEQILASRDVRADEMAGGNDWSRFTLRFDVSNTDNSLEFRTYWHGEADLDVAIIRVRRP